MLVKKKSATFSGPRYYIFAVRVKLKPISFLGCRETVVKVIIITVTYPDRQDVHSCLPLEAIDH